ncbi:family 78 glycoside hydrolase catalytic domain [Kineococcus sp. GCM10028916]|uniref:alpha-L-rhamnosidase n=1 Tax=Kineococcus sp. GCM10028916 TaxID=3273394 RepID=UPI00363810DF
MTPTASAPTFEHHAATRLGTGEPAPRLSWQVAEAPVGYRQQAVRLEVRTTGPDGVARVSVHEVPGDAQVLVPWPAQPLRSGEEAAVRVQLFDGREWGAWGPAGTVEVGLLDPTDWHGAFVGPPLDRTGERTDAPGRLRVEFELAAPARRARLRLSAHGVAEVEVNGRRAGDEELTPGWTSYRHRLRYATFDVTDHLRAGPNALGVWLGEGWWRGRLGFGEGVTAFYGEHLAAMVQLEITDTDGVRHLVATDATWKAGPGPITSSSLYDGEHFDARRHDPGWSRPGFDDSTWTPVQVHGNVPGEVPALVAPSGPPVRCTEELAPVEIVDQGEGRWLLDFGQNHSGRLRVRAQGPSGQRITLRHAEVLVDGELCTAPLRSARATDVLTLAGEALEWEPRFTVHGYRYAEVSGWIGPLEPGDVVSRVLHTDLARIGFFRSSDELVNRLHDNIVWGARSNFVDVPTDCPQRDERLGWTGDLQVFAPTAAFLFDVTGMLSSWLEDLAVEQQELDWVPPYVPYLPLAPFTELPRDPLAVWGDVAVLTPDVLHRATGDIDLLRRQLGSAVAWLEHVERSAGPGRICHDSEQLGDWLDPAAPPENPFESVTDRYLVATAYYAHSAARLAAVAGALGENALTQRYSTLAAEVRRAFAERYLRPGGRCTSDSQTAYALVTVFDLWPNTSSRAAGTARLAQLVREADGRIATGFAGTPVVCEALTLGGHLDEAYRLLQATDCPSWLYTVLRGATTIWERWDAITPAGNVNDPTMTSFNHYALGAVADWLHRTVAGLAPAEPGWRRIRLAPRPGGTLTHAGATHLTPYGPASIDWRLDGQRLHVEVLVPVGTTAVLDLPRNSPTAPEGFRELGHGRHEFDVLLPREAA